MRAMRHFSVKLNDGHSMPILGFGTSAPAKVAKSKVEEALERAIDVGYRHIDSAYLYQNEEEIGRAIRKKIANGTVKRDDIFCTSKLWGTFFRPELVQVFDFQLTPEDKETQDGLNGNLLYFKDTYFADHPDYPFNDEY
uniref:NADP-dependent oxidoreductase domain-containing protein n=1 Tax=Myotis myotis TaxID=51298 RepID=A0A7J8ALK2_MYOMY|nr:hypothetical protein mMyoMyo1_007915 [Myotis myotis]